MTKAFAHEGAQLELDALLHRQHHTPEDVHSVDSTLTVPSSLKLTDANHYILGVIIT